ncbi:MAG: aminoacyl-tRNA hydrolase [Bdellovibrionota bacterium]
MPGSFKLVVGLGNPGARYRATRHNAGFWVVDCLAALWQVKLKAGRWQGLEARAEPAGMGQVLLLEPQTYMNESGRSIAPLARMHKLAPEDVIVVHDDLDLVPGRIQVKRGGSSGGHNGLKSIEQEWGETDYYRVRVGIGRPPRGTDVVNYVLGRPPDAEWKRIEQAVIRATHAIEKLLREGLESVQQEFNKKAGWGPPDGPAEA